MTDIFTGDRSGGAGLRSLGAVAVPLPERVTAVLAVPVDPASGAVLAVRLVDRGIDIPGGHRQLEDKTFEATARRECAEEACAELGDLWLVDVVESDFYGRSAEQLTYMVIFGGLVARLAPFTPNEEVSGRELLDPDDFLARYRAGDASMMKHWIGGALKQSRAEAIRDGDRRMPSDLTN